MFFNYSVIKERKVLSVKDKHLSFNKIYVSKAEIKHTNSKAIITVYIYNKEKLVLLKKIKKLKKTLLSLFLLKQELSQLISVNSNNSVELLLKDYTNNLGLKNTDNYSTTLRYVTRQMFFTIVSLRRSMLKLHLNRSKFEEKFLHRLSQHISKYYGKKVEFNLVNIKHISSNVDIFTEILGSKMKKERGHVLRIMNLLLAEIKLEKEGNHFAPEDSIINPLYKSFMEKNTYTDSNLSLQLNNSILSKDGLTKLLNDFYLITSQEETEKGKGGSQEQKIRNIVLSNIKYKKLRGANIIVKGRLTKRYRADRAIYKFKWKGGLKNVDSSFRKLRSTVYRGHLEINLEKSLFVSKRRVGSFATTGWLATK